MSSDKNFVFNNGSNPVDYQEFNTANEIRATPVIIGNKMFIGINDSEELFAFNVETREKIMHLICWA